MRVALVLLSLLCACQSMPPDFGPGAFTSHEPHGASSLDAVIPDVMESLGYTLERHDFDGARGYVKGTSPSGAVTEVRWDWVFENKSYLQVRSSALPYGDQLSDRVLYEISVALNEPG